MFGNTESGLMTDEGVRAEDFSENRPELVKAEAERVNRWALRDRLRSKVLWAAVISELITIVFNVYQCIQYGFTENMLKMIAMSLLGILTIFGILNDPTNREGF